MITYQACNQLIKGDVQVTDIVEAVPKLCYVTKRGRGEHLSYCEGGICGPNIMMNIK